MGERTEVDRGPRPRTSVTLRDVARESGVSITTVSRILNQRASGVPIREETQRRVEETASRLGYRPNLLARNLRGQRTTLIGVIARDIGDPFHVQILKGVNLRAQERDYRVFLGDVDYQRDEVVAFGSVFERWHADGIVIIGDLEHDDEAITQIASHHHSLVGVTDRSARRPYPGVYVDNVAGTELALGHLWGLGHRAITCVSDTRTADGRQRIDIYRRFMRDHGATADIDVHITDQVPELALALGRRVFADDSGGRRSAIYATSDATAIGLLQAAHQSGIAVPERLSIVGFDDIDMARYTVPPLTTVRQGGVEMGRAAVDLLLRMAEDKVDRTTLQDVVRQPELVVRESTGPPNERAARAG